MQAIRLVGRWRIKDERCPHREAVAPTTIRSAKRLPAQKESKMIMEQLVTTEELATRMRVNPSTAWRWCLDDVGPPYLRAGTVYRYPISAVEAWIVASVRHSIAT